MLPISKEDIARWRAEIDLGVEFRDKEFGTYRQESLGSAPTTTLAGRNLDAYEAGARDEVVISPLNLVFPIVKIIVPNLFFQNPRATALPDTRDPESPDDAFYASELVNRDLRESDFRFKETCQSSVFDSFLLGFGVVKVGYATEFGADILPTKAETKQKFRERIKESFNKVLETLELKAPKPSDAQTEPETLQPDLTIKSESPYVTWISPFDFVVDPRARDLADARWVAQRIRRTLADVKRDRRYGKAKNDLVGDAIDDDRIQPSFIEEFQAVDVWEVHYRDVDSPTGITVLTLGCVQAETQALGHEHSEYDIGGWQYEWLTPNKHGHRLYPVSTISIMRPLIERIGYTLDAIIDQVEKFQAKIAYNDRVTEDGERGLDDNSIGARVKVDGQEDVRSAIAVITMEQVAGDMVQFINQLVDLALIVVGVTRAQFTGISTAQTATEAQLGQGGQNLRRGDESNVVASWTNRVVTKLWRVKAQFQDLAAVDLIQTESQLDTLTGIPSTQWYPAIDQARAERLKRMRFHFTLEVGSIQKPSLEIIRSQYEQFARAMMEPAVTQGLALESKRLSASEIIRQWARFFSEYGLQGIEKIVVPVNDPALQQNLMNYGQNPAESAQSNGNGRQLAGSVPNYADLVSAAAGEKGQGVPAV